LHRRENHCADDLSVRFREPAFEVARLETAPTRYVKGSRISFAIAIIVVVCGSPVLAPPH